MDKVGQVLQVSHMGQVVQVGQVGRVSPFSSVNRVGLVIWVKWKVGQGRV